MFSYVEICLIFSLWVESRFQTKAIQLWHILPAVWLLTEATGVIITASLKTSFLLLELSHSCFRWFSHPAASCCSSDDCPHVSQKHSFSIPTSSSKWHAKENIADNQAQFFLQEWEFLWCFHYLVVLAGTKIRRNEKCLSHGFLANAREQLAGNKKTNEFNQTFSKAEVKV